MAKLQFGTNLLQVHQSWQEFKAVLTTKGLLHQHVETEDSYQVFAVDGPVVYLTRMYKDGAIVADIPATNDDDRAEFLADFQSTSNRTLEPRSSEGRLIVSPTYMDTNDKEGRYKGFVFTALAGEQTFLDIVVTNQAYIQGAKFWIADAHQGDTFDVAIVDKDDVLGLFATFGLTVGVDVLELRKFVDGGPMHNGLNEDKIHPPAKGDLITGLYIRSSYTSTGQSDVVVGILYHWYED